MVKIYRTTDKIPVKIDTLEFLISPLSYAQKTELQAMLMVGDANGLMEATRLAVKYAVKGLKGVENYDGSSYELELDNGMLTDACVDDLLNLDQNEKIAAVCGSLLEGIPKEIVNPQTGKKLPGVSIGRGTSGKKK